MSRPFVSRYSGSKCGMCGGIIRKGDTIESREWDDLPYGEKGVLTMHAAKWQHRSCRHPLDPRHEAERYAASPEGKAEAAEKRRKRDAEKRRQEDMDERALDRAKRKLASGKPFKLSAREMRVLGVPREEIAATVAARRLEEQEARDQEIRDNGGTPFSDQLELQAMLRELAREAVDRSEAEKKRYRYAGDDWKGGRSNRDWEPKGG